MHHHNRERSVGFRALKAFFMGNEVFDERLAD
jgi:hypothetical protein